MALSLSKKSSLFIWICILLCLLPFVILSFFNVIAYDDYTAVGAFERFGFFRTQQMIYARWEGRFTATFLCGVCVKLGLLTRYYFLVFLLWGSFSWGAIYFFLHSINRQFLSGAFARSAVVQASVILFVLDIYVMVEISSGIYWFSPTAVYQTAFILFITLMGCLVCRLAGPGGVKLAGRPSGAGSRAGAESAVAAGEVSLSAGAGDQGKHGGEVDDWVGAGRVSGAGGEDDQRGAGGHSGSESEGDQGRAGGGSGAGGQMRAGRVSGTGGHSGSESEGDQGRAGGGSGADGTVRKRVVLLDALIVLLCILIVGSNEMTAIGLAGLLLFVISAYRYYGVTVPRALFLYLGVMVLAGVIVMLTSGTLSFRQQFMGGRTGYGGVLAILLFRVLSIFYYVLKEPLFWAVAGAVFVVGIRAASIPSLTGFAAALTSRPFFIRGMAVVVLLILIAMAPVLLVARGSVPERALNDMTSLAVFGLLAMVFLAGMGHPSLPRVLLPVSRPLVIVVVACGMLASYNYKEAWKNVFSGYFYHSIQKDRRQVFEAARERHERVVTIPSYEAALNEKIRQLFPHGAPVTLRHWLEERPTLLYFDNEAEDHSGKYLLQYYGLDSILVQPRP